MIPFFWVGPTASRKGYAPSELSCIYLAKIQIKKYHYQPPSLSSFLYFSHLASFGCRSISWGSYLIDLAAAMEIRVVEQWQSWWGKWGETSTHPWEVSQWSPMSSMTSLGRPGKQEQEQESRLYWPMKGLKILNGLRSYDPSDSVEGCMIGFIDGR